MADNINVTPGSGETVSFKDASGVKHQRVLVEYTDSSPQVVDATHGMPVQQQTGATFTIVGGAASGAAVSGNPVLLAGSDGTNARTLTTDTAGKLVVCPVSPGTPLSVGSTNAAAANNQTLTGAAGVTTYISGFDVTGLGATAGSTITITVTGLTNTLTYYLTIPAGATTSFTPLQVRYNPPLPASAANTSIVVNVPSFGAGNTTAAVNAYGFRV